MPRGWVQRIQDAVHGLMEFRGMEGVVVDILRAPELQRLRKIRQLGLGFLVFPTAEHSRLAHSLGAAYLAIRFSRAIKHVAQEFFISELCPDEAAIRDMGVAALCHDLGHGPLSHYWEREIVGHSFNRTAWAQALGLSPTDPFIQELKWHELVGHGLLRWEEGQLHRLLEQHEQGTSDRISRLLRGEYYIPYLPRLLNGDVDVDRADFLRRDTYQTGVAYGRYDLEWLISVCTIGEKDYQGGKEWVIGFDARKAIRVLEQFLIARRALYETVYHHKTVRCAEGMMALFLRRLKLAVKDGYQPKVAEFLSPLLEVMNGQTIGPRDLLKLDDSALWLLIDVVAGSDTKDETLRDLARRITSRDLFKRVPVPSERLNDFLLEPHAHDVLHEAVKPFCPSPSDAEFYMFVDRATFRVLSDKDSDRGYLVEDFKATPISDHPSFADFRHQTTTTVRVYVPREAVGTITRIIQERT